MSFKPGQSGNPGGRPKAMGRVRELCTELQEDAIEILNDIMRDESEKGVVRVAAIQLVLQYAVGRPKVMDEDEKGMAVYEGVELVIKRRVRDKE